MDEALIIAKITDDGDGDGDAQMAAHRRIDIASIVVSILWQ